MLKSYPVSIVTTTDPLPTSIVAKKAEPVFESAAAASIADFEIPAEPLAGPLNLVVLASITASGSSLDRPLNPANEGTMTAGNGSSS